MNVTQRLGISYNASEKAIEEAMDDLIFEFHQSSSGQFRVYCAQFPEYVFVSIDADKAFQKCIEHIDKIFFDEFGMNLK